MHRMILLKIGGKRLHLLKMIGALAVCGSCLGVLDSIATLFRIVRQVELAQADAQLSLSVFGLPASALTGDVVLGFFMLPTAFFMLWLALFIVGSIVYRSGEIIVPIEEDVEGERRPKKD